MEFGNPVFLWALPLTLLPLLLHLFFHRRKTVVKFSSLLFLTERERYFSFRRRLLETLLMMIRILILLLTVLALSRPFFKRFSLGGAGTAAIIVLDDTMSMQRLTSSGLSAFEQALVQAEALLKYLPAECSVGLLTVSGKNDFGLTRDTSIIARALRNCSVSGSGNGLAPSVKDATEILKNSAAVSREIYLISDFQNNAMPQHPLPLDNVRLFTIPVIGTNENLTVSGVVPDKKTKFCGGPVRIPFRVVNNGKKNRTGKISLEIDGNAEEIRNIELSSGAKIEDSFSYTPLRAGRLNGSIVVEDENVPMDNRMSFTINVSEHHKMLFCGYDLPDPFYFLRLALDPLEKPLHGFKTTTAVSSDNLEDFTLIVISPGHNLPTTRLKDYLSRGGRIIALPGSPQNGNFYRDFDIYGNNLDLNQSGLRFAGDLAELNELLQLELLDWKTVRAMKGGVPLAFCDKIPLITEYRFGNGRILALAFDLRRRSGNWPELKSFPVAMAALFTYAIANQENTVYLKCGEPLVLNGENASFISGGIQTLLPDGKFPGIFLPGTVFFQNTDIDAAIITAPEMESNLKTTKNPARYFDGKVITMRADADLGFQLKQFRSGTDFTGLLLLVALLLAAVEFMLGGHHMPFTGRRK
ncbi:MAG: VWA domain-containing protein [Victivallaceae bacterium]|nr:VWA domain-containing protein [Victivallaceae bacterium]